MIIDNAGTYTLRYTATDECGNSTTVDRELVVELPQEEFRTVLYTDGTFIINESSYDMIENIANHGEATNVYAPFDPNGATDEDKYMFGAAANRLWNNERENVVRVEIGSLIYPPSLRYWFNNFVNCTSMDLMNLNTSEATSAFGLFYGCSSLESLDVSHFDTRKMTTFENMFRGMRNIQVLDLSSFDTSMVTTIQNMFSFCEKLKTIYASQSFAVNNGAQTFYETPLLVGGAGTQWNSSKQTYVYARIDNPPDAPGYFTLKS